MRQLFLTIIISVTIGANIFGNPNVIKKNNSYYYANRIVVKFKNQNVLEKNNAQLFKKLGIQKLNRSFNVSEQSSASELSNIFTYEFSAPYEMEYVLKEIKN